MLIEEMHIDRFGGLENHAVSFTPNLTIVSGLNEAGKSTLRQFLNFSLFGWDTKGKGAKDKGKAALMQPWGSSGEFGGVVRLSDGSRIEAFLKPARGRGNAFDVSMPPEELPFRKVGRSVFEGVYSLDLESLVGLEDADLSARLGSDMALVGDMRPPQEVVNELRARAKDLAKRTGDSGISKTSRAGKLLKEIKELRDEARAQKKGLAELKDFEKVRDETAEREQSLREKKERLDGDIKDLELLGQAAERESSLRDKQKAVEELPELHQEVLRHQGTIENLQASLGHWKKVEADVAKKGEAIDKLEREMDKLTITIPEDADVAPLAPEVETLLARWGNASAAVFDHETDIKEAERKLKLLSKRREEHEGKIPESIRRLVTRSPDAIAGDERMLGSFGGVTGVPLPPSYASASIGVGAVFIILSLASSNILAAFAGVVLAVIGLLLRSWTPSGGGDPRALESMANALGVPSDTADLPRALDERLRTWRTHESSIVKLKGVMDETERRSNGLEESKENLREAAAERDERFKALRTAVPAVVQLTADEPLESVRARIEEYRTYLRIRRDKEDVECSHKEMQGELDAFTKSVEELWCEVFPEQVVQMPWTARLERLKESLDTEIERREALEDAKKEAGREEGELKRLMEREGFPDPERIHELLGTDGTGLPLPDIINERRDSLGKERDTSEIDWGECREELGTIREKIDMMEGSLESPEHFEALIHDREEDVEALKDKAENLRAAAQIVEQIYKTFLETSRPDVLRTASEWFAGATDGKWDLIDYDREAGADWLGSLGIRENKGAPLRRGEELSTSTRELLYLAIRLAIVDQLNHQNGAEPVPMIIDDALVNLDKNRLKKAAAIIKSFSERNQLVLLTCHKHILDAMKGTGLPKNCIQTLKDVD